MNHRIKLAIITIVLFTLAGCADENYSNGDRIGYIAKFSRKGYYESWKSWEGELNITQTGMNTSGAPFDFSIDNDNEPKGLVSTIDSAARLGWKVELHYHQVYGLKNLFNNRGHEDYFVTSCTVLDKKSPLSNLGNNNNNNNNVAAPTGGHVIDTVYVVVFDPALTKFRPGNKKKGK